MDGESLDRRLQLGHHRGAENLSREKEGTFGRQVSCPDKFEFGGDHDVFQGQGADHGPLGLPELAALT